MKVIAKQEGTQRFLIQTDKKDMAVITDLKEKIKFPEFNIDSIIARGYWEPYDHDEDLMKLLLKLPEAKA